METTAGPIGGFVSQIFGFVCQFLTAIGSLIPF
jgi:hypothetical protein